MKQKESNLFLIISGAILFNIIFWKEKLGVNTILFDSFICGSVLLLHIDIRKIGTPVPQNHSANNNNSQQKESESFKRKPIKKMHEPITNGIGYSI